MSGRFSGLSRWAGRFLLAGLSFGFVFVALEVALRLVDRGEAAPAFRNIFMPDPEVGYRLRPGTEATLTTAEFETTIRINQAGVRGDELGPKQEGERRVVVLGDSMVMAVQVPMASTFTHLLEEHLNHPERARSVRVINAGVQGYGPVEQYLFLKHVAAGFDPDLVLIVTFVGNDAVEAVAAAHQLAGYAEPESSMVDASRTPIWLRRLARRSAAVQLVRLRLLTHLGRTGQAPIRERPIDSYLVDPEPAVLRGFEVASKAVGRIAALAAEQGARTAIVLLPARLQLDDEDYGNLLRELIPRGAVLQRHAATDRFLRAYAGLGLPLLDLLPRFRAELNPGELFFRRNVHLTPRGHVVVADALAAFIEEQKLLLNPEL